MVGLPLLELFTLLLPPPLICYFLAPILFVIVRVSLALQLLLSIQLRS